jgi:hypothetical protein
MRLSKISLAVVAGTLVQLFLTAPAAAAGDCCRVAEGAGTKLFDEAKTGEAAAAEARPVPVPTPLDARAGRLADKQSYADVFRMLKEENACSDFFGGPARAVTAFNEFARQLRARSFGPGATSIRMSGRYDVYNDRTTGASYRLFDEAVINMDGPFLSRAPATTMHVGRFRADTRQARALMLLHELGHLMRGADGRWLLPNDGGDEALSDRNTRTVESRCEEQLLAIK